MADIEKLAREIVGHVVGKSDVRWDDERELATKYLALLDENTALKEKIAAILDWRKGFLIGHGCFVTRDAIRKLDELLRETK